MQHQKNFQPVHVPISASGLIHIAKYNYYKFNVYKVNFIDIIQNVNVNKVNIKIEKCKRANYVS